MVEKSEKTAGMVYGVNLSATPCNGQSAAKLRIGEGSTTIPQGSRGERPEVVGIHEDDDIV